MKPKTHTRTIWAARDKTKEKKTWLYEREPSPDVHCFDQIDSIDFALQDAIGHSCFATHYGLRPGQKKKLVIELTIREA